MNKQSSDSGPRTGAKSRSATAVIEQEAPTTPEHTSRDSSDSEQNLQGLDRETLRDLYYQMLLIRRFEEKSAESYSMGKIGGFCHLYIGQEAVAVGTISAIRPDDYVLASYREHAHAIAKNGSAGVRAGRVDCDYSHCFSFAAKHADHLVA